MDKTYDLYKRLGYWFLLLVPLVFFGFYKTYFAILFRPTAYIIHIHFTLMMLWAATLIIQPFLVLNKKVALHRTIGKTSYVLMPLLLLAAFFMTRFSYYRHINELNAQEGLRLSGQEVLQRSADYITIAILYFLWLGIFYAKGIINRHKSSVHARYMLAAALTMIGPTLERILFFFFGMTKLPGGIPLEMSSFLIQDTILVLLLVKDFRNKRPTTALRNALLIYITGQVLFFLVQKKDAWQQVMSFIMQPTP